MKKILAVLAFVLLSGSAFAQTTFSTTGITHNIADAYLSAADSVHTFGLIDMRSGIEVADSIALVITTQDSLRWSAYVVPVGPLGTWTIADSTAACLPYDVATYYNQHTAEGQTYVPWTRIRAAIGGHAAMGLYRVYIKVHAVGSEVASSGKKFNVLARIYK